MLVGGRDIEEHDKAWETVLQKAADLGITLNLKKYQFEISKIDFYGHRFTKDWLKPSPEKIRALKECKAPEWKEAMRSFLGMAGYLSKFIPRYSSLTAPLRKVTHKDTKLKWGVKEQKAFEKVKESIASWQNQSLL